MKKVIGNLEEDVSHILQIMASNGLLANPSKTKFMLLNNKDTETTRKIQVKLAEISEVKSAKLLGITMDSDQKWMSYFRGKKGQNEACGEQHLDVQVEIEQAAVHTQSQADRGG